MVSYQEAFDITVSCFPGPVGQIEEIELDHSLGRVLAKPLIALMDNPQFDNSAVDGYAIGQAADAVKGSQLRVVTTAAPGHVSHAPIAKGTAYRILTGAASPKGCYGIIMQEDVDKFEDTILLKETITQGQNIRRQGLDFHTGDQLVKPGTQITPACIAIAASQSIESLNVFRKPRVAIFATGDELVRAHPKPGQIPDSNGPMLEHLCTTLETAVTPSQILEDDKQLLKLTLASASRDHDIIIVSGGTSVGDRDHLPSAIEELGTVLLYKTNIKPGKPFLVGKIGKCHIFGLPGNPASAYVCFQLFLRPSILKASGITEYEPRWLPMKVAVSQPKLSRDHFIRCTLKTEANSLVAHPIHEQGSFGLLSLAEAEAIVRLPANEPTHPEEYRQGLLLI
jgi:molybdopterin molybdotransferase